MASSSLQTPPPQVNTYHCICLALLLATTHTLSSLPRRNTGAKDRAIILPISYSLAPSLSDSTVPNEIPGPSLRTSGDVRAVGYTSLIGLARDKKGIIVRREDGFERRICNRCKRCGLVVGYEVLNGGEEELSDQDENPTDGLAMRVLYLLPNGIMSTSFMTSEGGKGIGKGDVEVSVEGSTLGTGVWE